MQNFSFWEVKEHKQAFPVKPPNFNATANKCFAVTYKNISSKAAIYINQNRF